MGKAKPVTNLFTLLTVLGLEIYFFEKAII